MRKNASDIQQDINYLKMRVASLEKEANLIGNIFPSYTAKEEKSIKESISMDSSISRVDVSISKKGSIRINLIFEGELFVLNGKASHDETGRFNAFSAQVRQRFSDVRQTPFTKYLIESSGSTYPVEISTTRGIHGILTSVQGLYDLLSTELKNRKFLKKRVASAYRLNAPTSRRYF